MHRERFSDQASETQTINEQLGGAQLYLNAIRAESAEIDQKIGESLRKMTETCSAIFLIKTEIEKAKQETERQKGRLVVAKKRLATREAEKAKASQELQEAAAEAEEAAKEREIAEAALNKEATVINASNGLPFAPSP
jgi:epidermal growth factor receptor substrate 15